MGFMEAYKRLERLCADLLGDEKSILAYIDEMQKTPRGRYLVSGWNKDMENLNRYRRIRNRISHAPNCTEENMCTPADVAWIEQFYARILAQTDPLALYQKAIQPKPKAPEPKASAAQAPASKREEKASSHIGWIVLVGIEILLLVVGIIAFLYFR